MKGASVYCEAICLVVCFYKEGGVLWDKNYSKSTPKLCIWLQALWGVDCLVG